MDLIDRDALKAAYLAAHKGKPGKAYRLICEAPSVNQWISTKERMSIEPYEKEQSYLESLGYEIIDELNKVNIWISEHKKSYGDQLVASKHLSRLFAISDEICRIGKEEGE